MAKRKPRQEPMRCACEGGADRAKEHAKPGKKAADHGDPFAHTKACVHSELQHTTKALAKKQKVNRLRLQ